MAIFGGRRSTNTRASMSSSHISPCVLFSWGPEKPLFTAFENDKDKEAKGQNKEAAHQKSQS
eukprot:3540833-Amphidinium_carterae.1